MHGIFVGNLQGKRSLGCKCRWTGKKWWALVNMVMKSDD